MAKLWFKPKGTWNQSPSSWPHQNHQVKHPGRLKTLLFSVTWPRPQFSWAEIPKSTGEPVCSYQSQHVAKVWEHQEPFTCCKWLCSGAKWPSGMCSTVFLAHGISNSLGLQLDLIYPGDTVRPRTNENLIQWSLQLFKISKDKDSTMASTKSHRGCWSPRWKVYSLFHLPCFYLLRMTRCLTNLRLPLHLSQGIQTSPVPLQQT